MSKKVQIRGAREGTTEAYLSGTSKESRRGQRSRWAFFGMLEAKIAFGHMRHPASFIPFTTRMTLFGLSIGVMALIVVISVMNGFEQELKKNMMATQSHILFYRKDKGIENWEKLKAEIKKSNSEVKGVLPITYNEVLFVHEGRVQGGVLEGVEATESHWIPALGGRQPSKDGCFVGQELARKLNLKPGDTVKVLLTQTTANEAAPKIFSLKVLGVFDPGVYEYSLRYVYADLAFTQKHLHWGNLVSAFKVQIQNPALAKSVGREIRAQVELPLFMRTWMDMNRNIFEAIELQKTVMAIILISIIAVAAFNVMSSLIMIVIEKTKEIAILKYMGLTKRRIANIFLLKGLYMGVLGTAIGIFLAVIVCFLIDRLHLISLSPEVYYLSYLPVKIRWQEVLWIGGGMVILSLLASVLPSLRAASSYPAEGLRYE